MGLVSILKRKVVVNKRQSIAGAALMKGLPELDIMNPVVRVEPPRRTFCDPLVGLKDVNGCVVTRQDILMKESDSNAVVTIPIKTRPPIMMTNECAIDSIISPEIIADILWRSETL